MAHGNGGGVIIVVVDVVNSDDDECYNMQLERIILFSYLVCVKSVGGITSFFNFLGIVHFLWDSNWC